MIIVGVQNAGIAAAQGLSSSLIVLVSFLWSQIAFREPTWSVLITVACVATLVSAIVGMVLAAHKKKPTAEEVSIHDTLLAHTQNGPDSGEGKEKDEKMTLLCCRLPKFWFGVACAGLGGLTAGSGLVPLKLAQNLSGFPGGISYVISFGIGAVTANLFIWFVYVIGRKIAGKPPLPPLHFRVMLIPGVISGLLWSGGNYCQIYAIVFLGYGLGNGAVQAAIIVAGLWGIFFYHEIRGLRILLWLGFAILAVGSIAGISLMQYYATLSAGNSTQTGNQTGINNLTRW